MSRARSVPLVVVLGACAPLPPSPAPELPATEPAPVVLQDYKRDVAARIVRASAGAYSAAMPETMKSIVVLEITIDLFGQPSAVSVLRSNGYRDLEERALASVKRAAPYPLPAPELMQGRGSLTFLETFLFRDDDSFQVRSLVAPDWKPAKHEAVF